MAAQHRAPGTGRDPGGALQHQAQHLEGQLLAGPAHQVQGQQRARAHRVDVAQGVRRSNRAPRGRIVHDGSEEIHRHDQRAIRRDPVHRGVVPGRGVDQDVGICDSGQMTQHLRQLGGAELAGSTGAVRQLRQPNARALVPCRFGHEDLLFRSGML